MPDKRVLSIGVESEALSSVSADIEPETYALERAPTAKSALTLLRDIQFDLIVLAHPQPDLVLRNFLDELRHQTSESKRAKLLVIASDAQHPELHGLRERALEIMSRDEVLIGDLATRVLGGNPRVPVSVIVHLEAELPYGRSKRICQSENLSISGMLVRTGDTLPIDTPVTTSFSLPDGQDPIEARARVVRLTGPGEIPGIALNFENLSKSTRKRIEGFLADHEI